MSIHFEQGKKFLVFSILSLFLATTSVWAQAIRPQFPVPFHPYMHNGSSSTMHHDGYSSDTHEWPGPMNPDAKIDYFKYSSFVGICASFVTDSNGNLISVCVKSNKTNLYVIDPDNLEILGDYSLPPREDTLVAILTFQMDKLFRDTSGGSYFYLDHKDRVVVPTAARQIWVIGQHPYVDKKGKKKIKLEIEERHDLTSIISHENCPTLKNPKFGDPKCDKLTSVLADWQGRYWFTSRFGLVGTVDRNSGQKKWIRLDGEQIQNSFSVDENGAYIASDRALYHFRAAADGTPEIVWREAYDYGARVKPGQLSLGTGTTPTLFGNGYVSIGDNADPQMNVLIYKRDPHGLANGKRLICKVPVFQNGESASENSFIGVDRSVIVGNTYGYLNAFKRNHTTGGLVRIDIRPDESGCDIAWANEYNVETATPQLSLGNGWIYAYTKEGAKLDMNNKWFLSAIDFKTGKEVYKVYLGKGRKYDNAWGTISIGRDRRAYIGSFKGMVRVRD